MEGVEFLHANNVLHRDLKTKNIFLFQDHGDSHVRAVLGDFGTSKTLASASALAATIVGSPLYMSPEILDSEPHGMATDIWSLGCILYELLAHRPAFQAPSYPAVVLKITQGSFDPLADGISLPTRELVNRLLQKAPRDRPTAKEILQLSVLESFVTKVQADPVCAPAPDLALVAETTVVTIDNLPVENEREECAADNEVTEVSIPVLPPPAPVCQTSQLPPFTEPPNDVVSPNIDRDISLQPSVSDTVERSAQAKSVRPRRAYPQQTRTRVPGRQFDRQVCLQQLCETYNSLDIMKLTICATGSTATTAAATTSSSCVTHCPQEEPEIHAIFCTSADTTHSRINSDEGDHQTGDSALERGP